VKTRLGYDSVTVEGWVKELLMEQPAVISLHGRTLQQMYRGTADWSAIARAAALVKGTGTLLFGNGDIQNLDDIARRVRETGVDGVLVGRGVLGAPWFFRSKEQARMRVKGVNGSDVGWDPGEVSLNDRFAVLVDHAQQFRALVGEKQFYRMRKHLGWYCKGFPHAASLRAQMVRVSSVEELKVILSEFGNSAQSVVDSPPVESADETEFLTSRCS
jgi:tRNA-dihydrouridine synthase